VRVIPEERRSDACPNENRDSERDNRALNDDSPDFWDELAKAGNIVQRQANDVAVYFNPGGDLVIRERASWPDEDDHWVVIAEPNIQALIDRLCDLAGIGSYKPSGGQR
jgi:hypothetical protein